jgi:hypothetical protein
MFTPEQITYLEANIIHWHRLKFTEVLHNIPLDMADKLGKIYEDLYDQWPPFCLWCPSDIANLMTLIYREYEKQPGAIVNSTLTQKITRGGITTVLEPKISEVVLITSPMNPLPTKEAVEPAVPFEKTWIEEAGPVDPVAFDNLVKNPGFFIEETPEERETRLMEEAISPEISPEVLDKVILFPDNLDFITPIDTNTPTDSPTTAASDPASTTGDRPPKSAKPSGSKAKGKKKA